MAAALPPPVRALADRLLDAQSIAPLYLGHLVTYDDVSGLNVEDVLVAASADDVRAGFLYLDDTERVTVLRNNSLTVDGGVSFNVDAVGDFGASVKVDAKMYRVFLHMSYTAASVSRPVHYRMLSKDADLLLDVLEPIVTPPMIIERVYLGRSLTLTFYTSDKTVTTDLHANLPAGTAFGKVDVSLKTVASKMSLSDQLVVKGFSPDPAVTAQLRDPTKVMAAIDQLTMVMRQSNDPLVAIAYEAQPLDEIGRKHVKDEQDQTPATLKLRELLTDRTALLNDAVNLASDFHVPINTRQFYPDSLTVLAYEHTRVLVNLAAAWPPTTYDREYTVTVYVNGLPQNDSVVHRKLLHQESPAAAAAAAASGQAEKGNVSHLFNIDVLPGRSRIEFEVENRRLVIGYDVKFKAWDAATKTGTYITCSKAPPTTPAR